MNVRRSCSISSGIAICLLLVIMGARAQELGRLFTTPEERQRLDALRLEPTPTTTTMTPTPQLAPTAVPEPPVPVTVNGVVLRSHGAQTVWINGASRYDNEANTSGVRVKLHELTPREVPVILPEGRGTVRIKPGSTYTPPGVTVTTVPFYPRRDREH
jgi:hypothetical protein